MCEFVLLEEVSVKGHLAENLLLVAHVPFTIDCEVRLQGEVVRRSLNLQTHCVVLPVAVQFVESGVCGELQVT